MKIQTDCICPPIPTRKFDWSAIDADTYDADFDGENFVSKCPIGRGETEQEAIADLMEQLDLSTPDALDVVREAQESEMNK